MRGASARVRRTTHGDGKQRAAGCDAGGEKRTVKLWHDFSSSRSSVKGEMSNEHICLHVCSVQSCSSAQESGTGGVLLCRVTSSLFPLEIVRGNWILAESSAR